MLKGLFYVIVSAFIFAPCVGLLVFSVWLASDREKGSGDDYDAGQSLHSFEQPFELINRADMPPKRAVPAVESRMAAVHAGATLIRRSPGKVVQTNTAAVHAAATLIKLLPRTLELSGKPRTTSLTLTPPKFAQPSTGAIPPVPATNPAQKKIAPPSLTANASTGPATRQPVEKGSNVSPKATDPQIEQVKKGAVRLIVTRKQPRPWVARVAAKPSVSVKPIVRKRKGDGDVTVANTVGRSIDARGTDHRGKTRTLKSNGKERRRLPVATSALRTAKTKNWRTPVGGVDELKRAVGQLEDKDKRAFRSRCRQILSEPERFALLQIEICSAASL